MKFKRKKTKPASVGTFATITPNALNNFSTKDSYLENSLSYLCELEGMEITRRKIKHEKAKVLINDADLLFVSRETPFENIVEVQPLSIKRDSRYGDGIIDILKRKKKRPFLMRVDSLNYVSSESAQSTLLHYTEGVKNIINGILLESTNNKFTWEGR